MCALRNQSKSENENIDQVEPENIVVEEPMWVTLNFNGCNKLEQNSFSNIVAMKINVIFELNISNSFSADTNMERRHQHGEKAPTWKPADFIKNFKVAR